MYGENSIVLPGAHAHHAPSKIVPFFMNKCSISTNIHFKDILQQKKYVQF